jgi:NTP pyrophosphatase (non-canonical NTP hydrolase)
MDLREGMDRAYINACNKGFHDNPTYNLLPVQAALLVSEIGELVEADRKGDRENRDEEAADIQIRLWDMCGLLRIDLLSAVEKKMVRNEARPKMHGGKAY